MLKIELIALCDYASVSREGKLSINGIFDEFRTTSLPGVLGRGFLVATLLGEPNTQYKLTIKLVHGESGDSETTGQIDAFSGPNGKNNIIVELLGARFANEGKYYFKIFHGDTKVGSISLTVIYLKQAQEAVLKMPN